MAENIHQQREPPGGPNAQDNRLKCYVPQVNCFESAYDLCRNFLKDVLLYVTQTDDRLDAFNQNLIATRRDIEPPGACFSDGVGELTKKIVLYLRSRRFMNNATLRGVGIREKKYSRRILECEQFREGTRVFQWVTYRVRKHQNFLLSDFPKDFFIYMAYLCKFCVTLMLENKPFNEVELIAHVGTDTIFFNWQGFPNYALLRRFAEEKKNIPIEDVVWEHGMVPMPPLPPIQMPPPPPPPHMNLPPSYR